MSNGGMKSSVLLKYNGVEVKESLTQDMESFTFTDMASGDADTMDLELSNRTGKWMKGFYPQPGDYIKTWIRLENWQRGQESRQLFCGKFQIDKLSFSGFPETVQISGISLPLKQAFNVTQRNRSFKKTSVKQLLEDIAKRSGIALVFEADNQSIDQISQSGKTDMQFAYSICGDYDLSLKIYNDKMIVYDQTKYEKKKASHVIRKEMLGGSGAYGFQSRITGVYDAVKIQYTVKKGDPITYEYKIPGKPGNRVMYLTQQAESHKDAELKAKAALRKNLRENKSVTLDMIGDTRYKAAENIELEGFGKLDGTYFVDTVTHEKAHGRYTTSISAHPVVTNI